MPKNHPELTAERLREILSYDPITGVFHWLIDASRRVKKGHVAGCKSVEGYLLIGINGRVYRAHRLAWLYVHGRWPSDLLDHRNGIPSDNWIKNLREATNADNGQNCAVQRNNTSGRPGVCWDIRRGKWRAYIKLDGKLRNLGRFDTIDDAAGARAKAKAAFHQFQPFDR